MTKIVNALSLKIPPRDLKSKDARHLLQLICTQWLSLSTCIIQAAIDVVPAPPVAQGTRIPKMLYPDLREETLPPKNKLEADLYGSKSESDAYVAAYVSKMFAVPAKDLPENKKRPLTADEMRARARDARISKLQDKTNSGSPTSFLSPAPLPSASRDENNEAESGEDEVLLGFARLYSGTIRVGSEIYAVLPKYVATLGPKHRNNEKYLIRAQVEGLYVMMGRELVGVDKVKAGNIFAIKGLAGKVWRSATLCASSEEGINEENIKDWLINLGGVNRGVILYFPFIFIEFQAHLLDIRCLQLFESHWNRLRPLTCRN